MKLHHRILGEEHTETLLILHGLFGSSDNWQTLGKRFAEDYQVILVDQRNHGHSPHDPVFNYPVMAEDLLELVYDLQLTGFHLLGHSMGGKAAMTFAQQHPEFLDSLMVADIAPHAYPPHHTKILAALNSANDEILQSRGSAEAHLSEFIPEPGVRQFLMKNLYWKTKGQLAWRMNVSVLTETMEDILGEVPGEGVDVPTMFLRGTASNYIQESDYPAIRNQFPQVSFVDFEGAGHWLHAEQPDKLFNTVVEFMER